MNLLQEKQPRRNEVSGNITGQGGGKGGEVVAVVLRADHGVGMMGNRTIVHMIWLSIVIAGGHVL